MRDFCFIRLQHLIPQHILSRLTGKIAECENPHVKNFLIKQFIRQYQVNMLEADNPSPASYKNFNDFFTRPLAPGVRPIDAERNSITCPADGAISQLGNIKNGRIFQAKGQDFSLLELLGGNDKYNKVFADGKFATIYLAPKDYHRVHMPFAGTLRSMTYIPGKLFSVNTVTAASVPRLFARNERLVCIFDTRIGSMAVILVGAMIVAAIETIWAGQIAPVKRQITTTHYQQAPQIISLNKGQEMGRFKLGSTVILLFTKNTMEWQTSYQAGKKTQMGQPLGHVLE